MAGGFSGQPSYVHGKHEPSAAKALRREGPFCLVRQGLKNEENVYYSVRQQGRSRGREVDEERPEAEQGMPQARIIG